MRVESMWMRAVVVGCAVIVLGPVAGAAQEKAGALGVFEGQSDVGTVTPPGTGKFDGGVYTVTSAGANMWAREDAFHFVWKKMSGDAALTADITFGNSQKPDPHRKAVLILRQGLDANGIYVDAAQHGSGVSEGVDRICGPMADQRCLGVSRLAPDRERGGRRFHGGAGS